MHNYANVEAINQSKSLPGFRVVMTSLDGKNGEGTELTFSLWGNFINLRGNTLTLVTSTISLRWDDVIV